MDGLTTESRDAGRRPASFITGRGRAGAGEEGVGEGASGRMLGGRPHVARCSGRGVLVTSLTSPRHRSQQAEVELPAAI